MEIKSELKQPYTDKQRMDFIVEQNHKLGYEIREVKTTYEVEKQVPGIIKETITETIQEPVLDENGNPIFDEEGNPTFEEKIVEREVERTETEIITETIEVPVLNDDGNPVLDEDGKQTFETKTVEKEVVKYKTETVEKTGYNLEAWGYTEEEKQEQRKEQIAKLSMTKREMFLGLYQAKQITPDMLKAQITDPQALIEFEYANDYYRGNPLIDVIGGQLGFTSEMLDKFFETKDYIYLITCKLIINATPIEAIITGNGSYPYGTLVDYKVELEGYNPYIDSIELLKDTELDIELEKIEEVVDENTTDTTTDVSNEVGE